MIKVNTGFEMGSIEAIDARIVLTSEQMLNINDNTQPDIYFAMNLDDGKLYIYDKSATPNETTGKFSILEGGANNIWSGTKEEYEVEKDDIPEGTLIIITDDEGEIITNVFADVTQEEYDALPDTKLTDGIAYIISEEDSTTAKFIRNGKEISGGEEYIGGEGISIEYKEEIIHELPDPLGYYVTTDRESAEPETLSQFTDGKMGYSYGGGTTYYIVKLPYNVDEYSELTFQYTTYGRTGVTIGGMINVLTASAQTVGFIKYEGYENNKLYFCLTSGCPGGLYLKGFSGKVDKELAGNFIDVLYDNDTIKLSEKNKLYVNANFDNQNKGFSTLKGQFTDTDNPIAVDTSVIATRELVMNYTQPDYTEESDGKAGYIKNKPIFNNGIVENNLETITTIYDTKIYAYTNATTPLQTYTEDNYTDGKVTINNSVTSGSNGTSFYSFNVGMDIKKVKSIKMTLYGEAGGDKVLDLTNRLPEEKLFTYTTGGSSGGRSDTIYFEKYDTLQNRVFLKFESFTFNATGSTVSDRTYTCSPITVTYIDNHNVELSLTEEQKAEDKIYGYNPVEDEWQEVEAGESIQVLELPEITDDNKDKVYEYVGETTDDYTKGHFYEAKEKTAMFYPYSTDLIVNFREDLPDFIFVKNHEYVDNISVDDLYYKTGDERGKTGDLAKLKLKEGYSFELSRNDMFIIIQPTIDGEPAEDLDETHLEYNRLDEASATAVGLAVTEATVLEWTEVKFGSNTEIVTEWEDELSDEKVPSEKLVKDTIDETIIQVEELPSAKANVGKIYQYIGETTETYTRGHFYEAVKLPKVTASFQQWAGQDTYTAPYLNVYTVEGTAQTKDNLYYLLNGEMYDIDPNEIETFSSIVGWTLAIKYYVKDTEFTYSKGSTSNAPYTPVGWKEVELGGSGDTIFTPDSNATTVAVGGVPKGYDFTDKEYTINEVLNMIFFPYVAFTYTALAGGGSYEYGKEVTISKVTPTYEAGSKAITTVSVGTTAGSNDLYEGTSYASGAITLTTSKTFDGTTGGKVYCKLSDGTTTLEQSTTVSYVKSIYYATADSATVAPTSGTKGNNVDITVAADNYIYFLCPDTTKTQIQQYAVGQWNNVDTTYVGEVEFTNSENAALTYHAYRTPKLAAMTGKFQIK